MKRKKLITILSCIATLSLLLSLIATVSFAYFSKKEIYDGILGGQVELLFDRLTAETLADYQTNQLAIESNPEAEWGTEENPYVISNVKHLYNLSELQRLGYFYTKYIALNYNADGSYIIETDANGNAVGSGVMPYFLVCTPEGTPVVIDGNAFGTSEISTIGTEEYPFIGSVKGAFKEGSCEVQGKEADTSIIYNVTAQCDPENIDAGLFGYVGYLGDAPTDGTVDADGNVTWESFTGKISEISNLVLYDVKIEAKKESGWDFISELFEKHAFAYKQLPSDQQSEVPHENHHIGILAGHVAYTKVDYISVYYSSDDIVAIDLNVDPSSDQQTEANYMSVSGIIGYMDNMNPEVNGNMISGGSGTNNSDISYSTVGGGGALSGINSGYVVAKEIYATYGHYEIDDNGTLDSEDGSITIMNAVTADGTPLCQEWIRDRILWGTEATGRYYFYDGVFTFALSGTAEKPSTDVIEETWGENQDMEFSIGTAPLNDTDQTWANDWITNYSKGNNAVAAFVKKVNSDSELNEAILAGKQLFIMSNDGTYINLMTLFNQSTPDNSVANVEEKYYTTAIRTKFGDEEFIRSIVESLEGGEIDLSTDLSESYNTQQKLADALELGVDDANGLKAINVGMTTTDITLDDLKEQYKIKPTATGSYAYFEASIAENGTINEGKSVVVNGSTINDYYDYAESGYKGYFYYTRTTGWSGYTYTFYWQPLDLTGSVVNLGTQEVGWFGTLNFLGDVIENWSPDSTDENVYTVTVNGVPYTGVAINQTGNTPVFHSTGNAVNVAGASLTKPTGETINYFYKHVGSNEYVYSADNSVKVTTLSQIADRMSKGGRTLYTDGNGHEGIVLLRYPTYTLSNGDNYLRMVRITEMFLGFITISRNYTIWNGTDSAANDSSNFDDGSVANSTAATIKFDSNGNCTISFSLDGMTKYVSFNGTSVRFNCVAGGDTNLTIYTLEGTQALNYGRVTFDPKNKVTEDEAIDEVEQNTFRVDEYVLFANKDEGETEANGEFSVISLEELGWNNGTGSTLSSTDLQKKFHLTEGISFGQQINVLNGSLGTAGFLQAPVGSAGVKANIPQSCVAFRINKGGEERKIRVIVAVPTSEICDSENGFDYNWEKYEHYFNVWKMEEAGESTLQTFDADSYLDRFALPKSYPYAPGTSIAEGRYETVNIGSIGDDGKVVPGSIDYYCSFNGDRILVAYEFTVTEEGIYVLGMSGYNTETDEYSENGAPMEIVYFSAEGVASAGRDGAGGSQLGTIDFVYDYNGTIVTVKESSITDSTGAEDYNNYYPSYVLVYFDNSVENGEVWYNVNDGQLYVRRWVNDSAETAIKSTIDFKALPYETQQEILMKISAYARKSDIINASDSTAPQRKTAL